MRYPVRTGLKIPGKVANVFDIDMRMLAYLGAQQYNLIILKIKKKSNSYLWADIEDIYSKRGPNHATEADRECHEHGKRELGRAVDDRDHEESLNEKTNAAEESSNHFATKVFLDKFVWYETR